jgi:hypothetical protein
MPLKLMTAFLWHVRGKDIFGSWPKVVAATHRPACTMIILVQLVTSKMNRLKEKQQTQAM